MSTPLERLLDALPAETAEEILAVAGRQLTAHGGPSFAGVQAAVTLLLTPEEQAAALARLRPRGKGRGPAPLLRALFSFPAFSRVRRIPSGAGLLGRTDWLRFVLSRIPGRQAPACPLPLRPKLVYREEGFGEGTRFYGSVRAPRATWRVANRGVRIWPFPSARAFIRTRGLLNQVEWFAYARGDLAASVGRRPEGIPFNPAREYGDCGYRGMADWLGGPVDRPALPGFLTFRKSRALARRLGLRSARDWREWLRGRLPRAIERPRNLPALPGLVYPDCWRGIDAFLGCAIGAFPERRGWRPFDEARAFARSLGLSGVAEWRRFTRGELPEKGEFPEDIPANPDNVYESAGFRGYGDWLGSDRVSCRERATRPFEDAREFARALRLDSSIEWRVWSAEGMPGLPPRPPDIPGLPHRAYAEEGWAGWGDFLGTGNLSPTEHEYRSFEEARRWARSLGLSSHLDWRALCRGETDGIEKPEEIPATPDHTYGEEWTSWGDFLGTGTVATTRREYRDFAAARRYARSLGLRNNTEWRALCRGDLPGKSLPRDIPAGPDRSYAARGWTDWGDFLGTGNVHPGRRKYRSFAEARALARSLGFRNGLEWQAWVAGRLEREVEPPGDVPGEARRLYRGKGWMGWGDFLGTGNLHPRDRHYRSYEEAREYARSLPVSSATQWRAFCRGEIPDLARPPDIPAKPPTYYHERGWKGWPDFLGTDPG